MRVLFPVFTHSHGTSSWWCNIEIFHLTSRLRKGNSCKTARKTHTCAHALAMGRAMRLFTDVFPAGRAEGVPFPLLLLLFFVFDTG